MKSEMMKYLNFIVFLIRVKQTNYVLCLVLNVFIVGLHDKISP